MKNKNPFDKLTFKELFRLACYTDLKPVKPFKSIPKGSVFYFIDYKDASTN